MFQHFKHRDAVVRVLFEDFHKQVFDFTELFSLEQTQVWIVVEQLFLQVNESLSLEGVLAGQESVEADTGCPDICISATEGRMWAGGLRKHMARRAVLSKRSLC